MRWQHAMSGPILVVSDGSDVMLFERVEAAEGYLEAIDVLNEEFEVFGADGRRLQATAESDESPVVIRELPGRAPEPEKLRVVLRDYLLAVQAVRPELVEMTQGDLSNAGLPDLVSEMRAVEERHRQRSITSRIRRLPGALKGRLAGR